MNRRSIMILLIGIIAALSGLAVTAFLGRRRCADLGGTWDATARLCRLEPGVTAGYSLAGTLAGVVTGLVVAVVLYRAMLFVTGRATRRPR